MKRRFEGHEAVRRRERGFTEINPAADFVEVNAREGESKNWVVAFRKPVPLFKYLAVPGWFLTTVPSIDIVPNCRLHRSGDNHLDTVLGTHA